MNVVEVSQIEDIEGECKPTSNDKQTNLLGGLVQGSCMRSSYRKVQTQPRYINENKPSDLTRSFRILGNFIFDASTRGLRAGKPAASRRLSTISGPAWPPSPDTSAGKKSFSMRPFLVRSNPIFAFISSENGRCVSVGNGEFPASRKDAKGLCVLHIRVEGWKGVFG